MKTSIKKTARMASLCAVLALALVCFPFTQALAATDGTTSVTVTLTGGDLELTNAATLDFGSSAIGTTALALTEAALARAQDPAGEGAKLREPRSGP